MQNILVKHNGIKDFLAQRATIDGTVNIIYTKLEKVKFDDARIANSFLLNRVHARSVSLQNARINGSLSITSSCLSGLEGAGVSVSGQLYLAPNLPNDVIDYFACENGDNWDYPSYINFSGGHLARIIETP